MTISLFIRAGAIWLLIAVSAVVNGVSREKILVPYFGQGMALPMSGISLSIIVFVVTYLFFNILGKCRSVEHFIVGLQWVLMTLLLEFIFGHYVAGKSWVSIFQVFNVKKGDLFIIVLFISLLSPLFVAKIKGFA